MSSSSLPSSDRITESLSEMPQCDAAGRRFGMVTGSPVEPLLGRQRERAVLERLLEGAREGRGGVLALYGEPGVGKTALLEYAVGAGRGFRVARAAGVEGEMELAYAALQQL